MVLEQPFSRRRDTGFLSCRFGQREAAELAGMNVRHRWRLVSPKSPFNKSMDVVGHVLALIARLFEHLAAIPSVVGNRVDDAAYAYEDDKSN
jgi:hypothetical protein